MCMWVVSLDDPNALDEPDMHAPSQHDTILTEKYSAIRN